MLGVSMFPKNDPVYCFVITIITRKLMCILSIIVQNPHPIHVSFFGGASNKSSLNLSCSILHTKPVQQPKIHIQSFMFRFLVHLCVMIHTVLAPCL